LTEFNKILDVDMPTFWYNAQPIMDFCGGRS